MEGAASKYGLMIAALVMAAIVGDVARAVAAAIGSYWAGVAVLGATAALLAVSAKRFRGLDGSEYALLIGGSLLAVLIAGMTYAAIAGYSPR